MNKRSNLPRHDTDSVTAAWREYEAGKAYKRRIGLYDTVRENERFYRGEQWNATPPKGLPAPVFNLVKRTVDFLINSILSGKVTIRYIDEAAPFSQPSLPVKQRRDCVDQLNRHADYRWEKNRMDRLLREGLLDAAISGDAVYYTYWDPDALTAQPFSGDFVTERIDNVNFFVADVNTSDLEKQEYLLLAGREPVTRLRREAIRFGMSPDQAAECILPDGADSSQSGAWGDVENEEEDAQKATYLIRFSHGENGRICFEKSVRNAVIRRAQTNLRHYPVCYFHWDPVKNSFHGSAPITGMIQNQKYINKAYAMVMKHMMDTAFSKVIYDKKLIPEWTNEVGQAIGVLGGGDVSGAVTTVGVGELQAEYLKVIEMTTAQTKELMGATESALGEGQANNTSAILALREASLVPLETIRQNLCQCVEALALIWADMICAYYADGRMLPCREDGEMTAASCKFSLLEEAILCAKVDVGMETRFSQAAQMNLLDKLLDSGHITLKQYLSRLPKGILSDPMGLVVEQALTESKGGSEDGGIHTEDTHR